MVVNIFELTNQIFTNFQLIVWIRLTFLTTPKAAVAITV